MRLHKSALLSFSACSPLGSLLAADRFTPQSELWNWLPADRYKIDRDRNLKSHIVSDFTCAGHSHTGRSRSLDTARRAERARRCNKKPTSRAFGRKKKSRARHELKSKQTNCSARCIFSLCHGGDCGVCGAHRETRNDAMRWTGELPSIRPSVYSNAAQGGVRAWDHARARHESRNWVVLWTRVFAYEIHTSVPLCSARQMSIISPRAAPMSFKP